MALSTTSANLVRQKTRAITLNPAVFYGLKSLFLHLAANKGNPDLYYAPINGYTNASDGGNTANQVLVDAACQVYAIYLKKTGSTATTFKATDHATTAATNGSQDFSHILTASNEYYFAIYPDGWALANGLTVTEDTTATGSTLTLLANRIDGFAIVGA